jgi:uncharacterized membrane protein (UPF0127 family)
MRNVIVRNLTKGTIIASEAWAADTSLERRTGLLKHLSLPEGQGLWIVPTEAVHTFGMKFSIDLLFLDRRKKVLKIRQNMGRRGIAICLRAHSVLELPAGTIQATGTCVGDQLEFLK